MTREEMIQKLNQRIADPNSVVLFYQLGRWTQLKTSVSLSERFLSVPDMNEAYLMAIKMPESLRNFIKERVRVYDAKLLQDWGI